MSEYFYRARDKENRIKEDYIQASNITEAAKIIEKHGLIVLEIKEEIPYSTKNTPYSNNSNIFYNDKKLVLSQSEKRQFFNSFASLYSSGMSMIEIFKSLISSSRNYKIKGFCNQILKKIEKGSSLKKAMRNYTKVLGLANTMLIVAGERSGKLEIVLNKIIKNIDRENKIKRNILASLAYPFAIFLLAIAVFIIFKFGVIKVFQMSYSGITRIEIIEMLIWSGILALLVVSLIIVFIVIIWNNKLLLRKIQETMSTLPMISKLLENFYFTNFFSVMALAYDSGLTPSEALELGNSVINISHINVRLKKSEKMISQGCELTTAFNVANVFSSDIMSQISSGEQAGELEKVFENISKIYENNLELTISIIMKLLNPVMLILVGIFVGVILYQGYSAMYGNILGY